MSNKNHIRTGNNNVVATHILISLEFDLSCQLLTNKCVDVNKQIAVSIYSQMSFNYSEFSLHLQNCFTSLNGLISSFH